MIARQYNRKIDVYKTDMVPDGYGGNTVTDVLIGSFWAEVKQNTSYTDNAVGDAILKASYTFKIRANSILNPDFGDMSIIYRGVRFMVNSIVYADELFRELTITAIGS